VARGSGIVGGVYGINPGKLHVYFEGNIHGAGNINTFEDKLFHAWGRMDQRYPTTAQMVVDDHDVLHVGAFDPESKAFFPRPSRSRQVMLKQWLENHSAGSKTLPD